MSIKEKLNEYRKEIETQENLKRKKLTKETVDKYLSEVAKEYRKFVGKSMPAEIVLIGGASILINYGFRESTTDLDAIIQASGYINEAIIHVRDKYGLTADWLNSDFTKSASYSPKLIEHSNYYRTFSNVLTVRTVSSDYLLAMKLRSGRIYKNDLSDIVGIIIEEQRNGTPITYESIDKAVCDLYGGWDVIPDTSKKVLETVINADNIESLFYDIRTEEIETRNNLKRFVSDYPNVVTQDNIVEISKALKKKDDLER